MPPLFLMSNSGWVVSLLGLYGFQDLSDRLRDELPVLVTSLHVAVVLQVTPKH